MASIYVNRQDPESAAQALEDYLAFYPDADDVNKVRQMLSKLRGSPENR